MTTRGSVGDTGGPQTSDGGCLWPGDQEGYPRTAVVPAVPLPAVPRPEGLKFTPRCILQVA